MYDYLIVGCGLYGTVFANHLKSLGKKVLIIDKRNHIAGNCYTENINNINIHKYGPHIFHTSSKKIWDFVNRFASFNHYVNRPKVMHRDTLYSFPINLFTLYQLWGVSSPEEAKRILDEKKIPCDNPGNLEEWILSQVGKEIYEIFIKGYTTKQWGKDPRELPADIIKRLPIRLNFDDNYFNDIYQGIPIGGYTEMFEAMLEGIDIALEEDYFSNRDLWDSKAKKIIYTGRVDEFFDLKYGELEYRGLRFDHQEIKTENYQGNAIINYTEKEVPFTRIIEHKHFEFGKQNNTVITKEYPDNWDPSKTPYYPINTDINNEKFYKYKKLTNISNKYIFGGRLAEYKYYDMHQVIGSAMNKFYNL